MSATSGIPLLNLVTRHEELEKELTRVFRSALKTAGFIGGAMVEGFERDFAAACNTQYCVGVGIGTDALRFILISAGIKKGDIVIPVQNTFIATTEAISQAGGRPEFVDVCEQTYNLDPARLQEYFDTKCYFDQENCQIMKRCH